MLLSKKKLVTVDEYDQAVLKSWDSARRTKGIGVACPTCTEELEASGMAEPIRMGTAQPPKKRVTCGNCKGTHLLYMMPGEL